MLQEPVTPFSRPDLGESRSLQLADHLGPGHFAIVNLPLGFVNATNWGWGSMGSIPICGRGCDRRQVVDGVDARNGEAHFHELEPAERVAAADRAHSTSSVSERSAAVWCRPTWFDSGPRWWLIRKAGPE